MIRAAFELIMVAVGILAVGAAYVTLTGRRG
jgi:hypothetical protein